MENNFDGGVLEVSTDGGATFQDIVAAGGTFATGGYNGTISVAFANPIGGRQAWTGNLSAFVTTTVNFPASFAGHSVILRFRRATDATVSGQGWRIDTISVDDVAADCVLTCPANITVANDPDQCGAVVNYPSATPTGTCGDVSCSPSSGSSFPLARLALPALQGQRAARSQFLSRIRSLLRSTARQMLRLRMIQVTAVLWSIIPAQRQVITAPVSLLTVIRPRGRSSP